MINSPFAKLPEKIAHRSPARFRAEIRGPRQRQSDVQYTDGEALVPDVRAGMTPAEQVQRKLMSLLHR